MTTHDPRQVIEQLRNHLAMHDRRILFLFGAGTSCAVNIAPPPQVGEKPIHKPLIPGIDGLTEICLNAVRNIGESHSAAWDKLAKQCKYDESPSNIEQILSRVRIKIDAVGDGETLLGLDRNELLRIEKEICSTIAKTVNPAREIIPNCVPHNEFALWVKKVKRSMPIEVFTTNYDLLLELAFERERVPVFDGFVGTYKPFFYPECLDDEDILPKSNWIRLWKMHGSVNWIIETRHDGKRIIRNIPSESGELILPSQRKYDESRKQPYMGYMDRLFRTLNEEHAILITCGYSFGDEHINAIIFGVLNNRKTANVIALQYLDLEEQDKLVAAALKHTNLTVIGPNAGVISGIWGLWQLSQPVDEKTHSFMDSAFDSNASPEENATATTTSADLIGKMRLGDFNWFCRFLSLMGGNAQ